MNTQSSRTSAFILIVLFPGVMVSADAAKEARRAGASHLEQGDFDKAISAYTEVIRIDPNNAEDYYGRAYAYRQKGDFDREIADYTEAIRLKPKAIAYCSRGIAYGRKGEHDKAIADFNVTIQSDPKNAEAYYNRGISTTALTRV